MILVQPSMFLDSITGKPSLHSQFKTTQCPIQNLKLDVAFIREYVTNIKLTSASGM